MFIRKNRLNEFMMEAYSIGFQHGKGENKKLKFLYWLAKLVEHHKHNQFDKGVLYREKEIN